MGLEIIEDEKKEDDEPKGIGGFVVVDGTIVKVKSVEDLKHIVQGHEEFAPF